VTGLIPSWAAAPLEPAPRACNSPHGVHAGRPHSSLTCGARTAGPDSRRTERMLTQQIYKPMGRPSSTRRWAARRWTNRLRLIMFGVSVAIAVALSGTLGSRPVGLHLVTIPAGTELVAVVDRTLSTAGTKNGQAVFLETREPVRVDSALTLPAGLLLKGRSPTRREPGEHGGYGAHDPIHRIGGRRSELPDRRKALPGPGCE
jgi:hypothetical protein